MVIKISREEVEKIYEHAKETYPEECCGFLIGEIEKRVLKTEKTRNISLEMRERRYLIDPKTIYDLDQKLEKKKLRIIGYYHSHPNSVPIPSEYDRNHAWPWYTYIIVSIRNKQIEDIKSWILDDDREKFNNEELEIV